MAFTQFISNKVTELGPAALNPEETFDQREVLNQVEDYLLATLQLKQLSIVDTSDPGISAETAKSCSPGAPFIVYNFESAEK